MVRRIALLVVVSMLMTWSVVVAEDFSFRNGITFHDTVYEVAEKEDNQLGRAMLSEPYGSTDNIPPAFHKYFYTYMSKRGNIAGIPESQIMYKFNSHGVLREADYFFKGYQGTGINNLNNDFNGIEQILISIYGNPSKHSNIIDLYPIRSESLDYEIDMFLENDFSIYTGLFDSSEWVLDFQEYKIKIEHFIICAKYTEYSQIYHHALCYCYFTDDDLNSVLNTSQPPHSTQINSILNDL